MNDQVAQAPSPFTTSGLQYAFDSTSLGWLMECDRKYYYAMVEGWRSRHESIHLRFGQLYHAALEFIDKRIALGTDREDALHEVVLWLLLETWDRDQPDQPDGPWQTGHDQKTRETLVRSVIWYCDKFANDPAQTLIFDNGTPAVELSFRFETAWSVEGQPYLLCGHIDRIVNWAGDIWATDRKTSGSVLNARYFDQYKPDIQMSLYTMAAQVVFHTPAKGVMIDAAQIAIGFTDFKRGVTYRTNEELDEDLKELEYWFKRAAANAATGYWPKNPKSCHKYGGCQYVAICSKAPSIRAQFLEANYVKHPWNPLQAR